jgi:hypothetical protein
MKRSIYTIMAAFFGILLAVSAEAAKSDCSDATYKSNNPAECAETAPAAAKTTNY